MTGDTDQHKEPNSGDREGSRDAPWLQRHGATVTLVTGIAVIAMAAVLAFTGHDEAACAFVFVGAGLVFVSTFSHRIHGDTSFGPQGFKTAVLAQTEAIAREKQLPDAEVSTAKALGAFSAEVYESALQSGLLSTSALWRPPPSSMYAAGTATQIARHAVEAVQGDIQEVIPQRIPGSPTESFTFRKST